MIHVAALYQFTAFPDPGALRAPLLEHCAAHGVKGTLLLAHEGINGTIAGEAAALDAVLAAIRALPGCAGLEVKFSAAPEMPFGRMKVRVKREIVTMGEPDLDPAASVGRYVAPQDWNALIADPETLVIDTRNDYEVAIGSFAGAVDPRTRAFRDFPAWFREHREALLAGKRRVAMFCTGGIRCEKSTSFLRREGVEEVYHLRGGILKYLEDVPEADSLWRGECFVFDERVSLGHGLAPGSARMCRACGRAVLPGEACAACEAPAAP
ncbi:MAG: rhodanese-related sulfurtransferase [Erythrobacter sp.]